MEAPGCGPHLKRCSLQFSRSSAEAVRDGAQKSVTMAPNLRLLTDRQYRVRQPLVTDHRTSTLKTHTEHRTQQLQCDVKTEETTDQPPLLRTTDQPPLLRTTDLPPLLRTTDQPPLLRTTDQPPPLRTTDQPSAHSAPSLSGSRRTSPHLSSTPLRAPLSSVLQVQRLKTPVRPQLSSTVLYPTYTPRSAHRRTYTEPKQSSRLRYQAEYWACAIPTHPPPTPSRGHSHQDYEALLDYTYPLRPGPQPGQLSPTHCTLQDSGIEVDLSTGQSELNLSFCGPEQAEGRCQRSPETPLSPVEHVLSPDTLDWCKQDITEAAGPWCLPSAALITLPLDRGAWGDSEEEDMEFRPLPKQLQQLQQLSAQVREMAVHFNSALWDPPVGQDTPNRDEEKHCSADRAALRTEDALRTDVSLSLDYRRQEQDSLMEHISVFCSHLEQLIHSLYITSQKIQVLLPPTVDIHSVKSSLAQYQCFQREVSRHLPLTSSVLQTGHLLLSCIQTTSPVLRDALLLVESQSKLLERHTERFFSSILTAMDTLTQDTQNTLTQGSLIRDTLTQRGESGAGTQERSGVMEDEAGRL